jgi:hypothetical protein
VLERLGLGVDRNPLACTPCLDVIAVEDRLAPEFTGEPRVMLAEVSTNRNRAALAAIAKPRCAEGSRVDDVRIVPPTVPLV